MVRHIVFLKLEDNSFANKKVVQERIMSMQGKIDVLKHLEVGINFSPEERAFDLALVSDFDDKEGLNAYAINPLHLEVISFLKSIHTVTKVVDYEF